jgi:hypothetical protein
MLLVLISVRGSVKPQALFRSERLGKFIKINHLISSRTCDLPSGSTVPHPLCNRVPALSDDFFIKEKKIKIVVTE